jgi:uncharacterized protein with HEPN domain
MQSPDAIRLRHMREAVASALEMAAGSQRPDLTSNTMLVSMRNHPIHAYFDLNLDIVWTTVTDDLPSLLPALDSALAGIDA